MKRYLLNLLFLLVLLSNGYSQTTKFLGRIVDSETKKPIPDVLIIYSDSIQTRTNFLGYFEVETAPTLIWMSHINYLTSSFDLDIGSPKFLINLSKQRHIVEELILDQPAGEYLLLDDLPKKNGSSDYPSFFEEGTNRFNDYLKISLTPHIDSLIDSLPITVAFTVRNDGQIRVDSICCLPNSMNVVLDSVYSTSPLWSPAIQAGKPLDCYFEQKINTVKEVFTKVEEPPVFEGGMAAFFKYIGENMRYPSEARRMGIEGRVYVQFVVDKDGSIIEVKTVKGIGAGCDQEAERVISSAPKFSPGTQKGRPVKVRMVMPIIFKLGDNLENTPSLKFEDWFSTSIKYHQNDPDIREIIYCSFEISEFRIQNIRVINPPDSILTSEIVRIIENSPSVIINKYHGTRVTLIAPLKFGKVVEKSAIDLPQGKMLNVSEIERLPSNRDTSSQKDLPIQFNEVVVAAYGNPPSTQTNSSLPANFVQVNGMNISKPFKFSSFDEVLLQDRSIDKISIVGRSLENIPSDIGEFKKLKFLDLENNKLTSLPVEIGSLGKLSNLYLGENKITQLPDELGNLKNITELSLAGNSFNSFPEPIVNLPKLIALDLGHNSISEIPKEISKLKNLKVLVISNNNLTDLPDEFFSLQLEKLYLGDNKIPNERIQAIKERMRKTQVITD